MRNYPHIPSATPSQYKASKLLGFFLRALSNSFIAFLQLPFRRCFFPFSRALSEATIKPGGLEGGGASATTTVVFSAQPKAKRQAIETILNFTVCLL